MRLKYYILFKANTFENIYEEVILRKIINL